MALSSRSRQSALILFASILALFLSSSIASPSCCTRHLLPLIPDPSESPPDSDRDGRPRLIPDPDPLNVRPDDWDDEDDGEWEPKLIDNPDFAWRPKLIPNPSYRPPPLHERLTTEILKAVPWVVLGVLATALLDLFGPSRDALRRQLTGAGPLKGAILGVATPMCSCGSLPVAAGLAAAGAPIGAVVSFLTAAQSSGLDSAAVTWGLLGPAAALCRLGGAIVLAMSAGCAAAAAARGKGGKRAAAEPAVTPASSSADKLVSGARMSPAAVAADFYDRAVCTAADVFPPVLIGLCLSTAVLHYSPHLATAYQALQVEWGVDPDLPSTPLRSLAIRIAALAAVLPLQLCEHTTVAYAAAVQKAGGAPGLAFAFLLAAPATNLPSLLLLMRAGGGGHHGDGGRSAALAAAASMTATALVLSYLVDIAGVDLLVVREADEGTGGMPTLPDWYGVAAPWIGGLLSAGAIGRALGKFLQQETDDTDKHGCCPGEDGHCGSGGKSKVA